MTQKGKDGFLVDYNGGIYAKDYTLVDEGDGNGFSLRSDCCSIYNHTYARQEKGVVELTVEQVTRGAITLGSAERVVMTAEDAQDLITSLREAMEDAEEYQWTLRDKNEAKAKTLDAKQQS